MLADIIFFSSENYKQPYEEMRTKCRKFGEISLLFRQCVGHSVLIQATQDNFILAKRRDGGMGLLSIQTSIIYLTLVYESPCKLDSEITGRPSVSFAHANAHH